MFLYMEDDGESRTRQLADGEVEVSYQGGEHAVDDGDVDARAGQRADGHGNAGSGEPFGAGVDGFVEPVDGGDQRIEHAGGRECCERGSDDGHISA